MASKSHGTNLAPLVDVLDGRTLDYENKRALCNRSGISMETLPYRLKELFLRSLRKGVLEHLMSLPLLIQLSFDFFRDACTRHEMVRNVGVISCSMTKEKKLELACLLARSVLSLTGQDFRRSIKESTRV
jgi:hypothetical protein